VTPAGREQYEQALEHIAQQCARCGLDPAEARQGGEVLLGDGDPFASSVKWPAGLCTPKLAVSGNAGVSKRRMR
jgi:hypothetical protein